MSQEGERILSRVSKTRISVEANVSCVFEGFIKVLKNHRKIKLRFYSNVAPGGMITDGETVEGKIQICKEQVRGLIERNYSSSFDATLHLFSSQAPYKKTLSRRGLVVRQ